MPLDKQNISISFAQGVDLKTDEFQVIPGKFLTLENAVLTSSKAFTKRFGYIPLSAPPETNITLISPYKQELTVGSTTTFYSYTPAIAAYTAKGNFIRASSATYQIVRNSAQQTTPDVAFHPSGIEVYTWEDTRGNTRYSVIDTVTRETLVNDTLISANSAIPKPVALGAYVVIFYRNTSNNHLAYRLITALTPTTLSAETDLSTTFNSTNTLYDVAVFGIRAYVAFNNNAAGISLTFLDKFLNIAATTSNNGSAASNAITVFVDPTQGNVWAAWSDGTNVKYLVKDMNLGPVLGPTQVEAPGAVPRNITGNALTDVAVLYYELTAAATYNEFIRSATVNDTGTILVAPAVFLRSVGLAGKSIRDAGRIFIPLAFETADQPTYFLVNSSGVVVARWVVNSGGGLTKKRILPEFPLKSGSTYLLAGLQKDLLTTQQGVIYTQTGVISYSPTLQPAQAAQKAELGGNLQISGGILWAYDGAVIVEHGFNYYPENIGAVVSPTGGALTAASSYQFSVTYEWTDAQGAIHRSTPSIPTTITSAGATTSVALTIPTLRLTSKPPAPTASSVRIVVYRTTANGTIFYQDTTITNPLLNDATVDTVLFTSTQSDLVIVGNPLLYTTGGVVENITTPPTSLLTTYKNRVLLVPDDSRLSFWYSKIVVPGSPAEFSDLFVEQVDQRGGNITGLIQMDDKLIIFKQDNVMAMAGNGPDDTGSQNDFLEPQVVSADGGCVNSNSIVLMPSGVMYKSQKGIYLLDRSLAVTYIGAPVEAFNLDTIVSATLIPGTTQVRFCLNTRIALTYDYYYQQWSVFTNLSAVDSTFFAEQFTYASTLGSIFQEAPGVFTDAGQFIRLRAVTSWLALAGLQGFQRAYRFLLLGHFRSPHSLLTKVAYDYNEAFVQSDLIPATTLLDPTTFGSESPFGLGGETGGPFGDNVFGGNPLLYQFRVDLQRQKCEAVQFSFEDSQAANYGEGMTLSAFNILVGAKKGQNKLPASRQFGGRQ